MHDHDYSQTVFDIVKNLSEEDYQELMLRIYDVDSDHEEKKSNNVSDYDLDYFDND